MYDKFLSLYVSDEQAELTVAETEILHRLEAGMPINAKMLEKPQKKKGDEEEVENV